jgi:hypothetical protein
MRIQSNHQEQLKKSRRETGNYLLLGCAVLVMVSVTLVFKTQAAEKEPVDQPPSTLVKVMRQAIEAAKAQEADMILLEDEIQQYDAQRKTETNQRDKDPAWQPSHQQVNVIKVNPDSKNKIVNNFCLNLDGNLLFCCGDDRLDSASINSETRQVTITKVGSPAGIRVFSPDGKLLRTWNLDFKPQAICVHRDGTIFVAGDGRLAKLSPEGKTLSSGELPGIAEMKAKANQEAQKSGDQTPVQVETKQQSGGLIGGLLRAFGLIDDTAGLSPQDAAALAAITAQSKREITGIAVTDQDLFVACRASEGSGYAVWRMDHNFQNPKQIVAQLSGCCGQMDVQARNGELWIPENGRHRVNRYDREGKLLTTFGKEDRKAADGFGGCCEPKNVRFGLNGELYTAESGPPVVVKRFSPEGKFLGVVGLPKFETGCVRVTVEMSKDGNFVYVLNTDDNAIHVLAAKSADPKKDVIKAEKTNKEKISIILNGKIIGVDFLSNFSGSAILAAQPDVSFVVKFEVLKLVEGEKPKELIEEIMSKKTINIAIHSPAISFREGSENLPGKEYTVHLSTEKVDDKIANWQVNFTELKPPEK